MSKKMPHNYRYLPGERAAEREIDAFLRSVTASGGYDVLADLRSQSS